MSVQNAESFYVSPFLLTLFVGDWFDSICSCKQQCCFISSMLLCRSQVSCFLLCQGPCLVPSCITEEGGIGLETNKRKTTPKLHVNI